MRFITSILLLSAWPASGQLLIPPYSIVRDSASHITVFHAGNSEKNKLRSKCGTDTLALIQPDIMIKNGIVDHKGLTGEMFVREYYIDSALIGYIDFNGADMLREIYFNIRGNVYLEKVYEKGALINANMKVRHFIIY